MEEGGKIFEEERVFFFFLSLKTMAEDLCLINSKVNVCLLLLFFFFGFKWMVGSEFRSHCC